MPPKLLGDRSHFFIVFLGIYLFTLHREFQRYGAFKNKRASNSKVFI